MAASREQRRALPVNRPVNLTQPRRSNAVTAAQKRSVTIETNPAPQTRLRVGAYCRVSTASLEQETSIVAQRRHFEDVIAANPDWELAGIYWEAGVSGTKAEKRPELQRLIADCKARRVDLVLTKSISRFARNTTDCLKMVRTLVGLGVNIVFEKEKIDTRKMESEFLLTLFSSIAEEESQSIGSNIKWAIQKRFVSGTYRYSRAPYGYTLQDGNFVLAPEEAEIVREIFRRSLSGEGTVTIARDLNDRGVPTGTRRRDGSAGVWTASMILGMLKNVTYTGDVLMQKTWSDFQCKRMPNRGQQQQYYMDEHNAAIIDHETFERANAALAQRGREKGNLPGNATRHNRYAFSGKLYCARCGGGMKRVTATNGGEKRYYWGCVNHLKSVMACGMKREREDSIKNAFATMLNKLAFMPLAEFYIQMLLEEERAVNSARAESMRKQERHIEAEESRRLMLLAKGCVEPLSFRKRLIALEVEEAALQREERQLLETSPRMREALELKKAVAEWAASAPEPDALFERIIERVSVQSGERAVFELKCGLNLTEPLGGEEGHDDAIRICD